MDTMSAQSELMLAGNVINVDGQSVSASDESQNCSTSEPVEHGVCESVQSQPTVAADMEEETGTSEVPDVDTTERSEVESAADTDNVSSVQPPSAQISPQLTTMDVSEQLAVLRDTVQSLHTSNDELRQSVTDGMTKVVELETAYAKSVTRNRELELELAQLRGCTERAVSDVALLSTSLAQISTRVDKQTEVAAAPTTGDGDAAAAAEGTDTSSLQPAIEQRVSELELKLQQSVTRFGEFASALDSIERDLQRYIRRHSLVIKNLCPKEDRTASDAFLVFVNSVLGVAVDDSDIDGLHLLDKTSEDAAAATKATGPDKKDHRPRPILITFTCYRTRTQVYKAWLCHRVGAAGGDRAAAGSLSGERGHGVCIHEYLTPAQDAIYRQADETRQRRPDLIMDCWTFRGRTFVRTSQGEVCEFDSNQFSSKETKTKSCLVM